MRYLAWAASRSVALQGLEIEWSVDLHGAPLAEAPPAGVDAAAERTRPVQLLDPAFRRTRVVEGTELRALLDEGWIPDPGERSNFLEGVHIQAHYFQARWFPRLKWFTLRPPSGEFFVIGDRPVGWGVPDALDAPPSCLRDDAAFLIAPLSRSLAIVGRNEVTPWKCTPRQVNTILAAWSREWIAGPAAAVVSQALSDRRSMGLSPTILQ